MLPRILEAAALGTLFQALHDHGYTTVGPTVKDGAIVYDPIQSEEDLPRGWTEVQDAGRYGLERRDDDARFGYTVGPHAWKRFLHPPVLRLWRADQDAAGGFTLSEPAPVPTYAFIGVRPCDVHAIRIQDRVYTGGAHVDPDYLERRRKAFVVAVNCTEPGGTCFCASMGTGPRLRPDEAQCDLVLTERLENGEPTYLIEVGSERGEEILATLPTREPTAAEVTATDAALANAAERMGRHLDTDGLAGILAENLEHPRWDDVAARCVTCGNCTLACPTCFCTTVQDATDLTDGSAERRRVWDSCFTLDYSYVHGGPVRPSNKARYRQWLTHKLSTWIDQFGTAGCVGCGRCITWCPVAIDITQEAAAIRRTSGQTGVAPATTTATTTGGEDASRA